jgi:hypothetical protein
MLIAFQNRNIHLCVHCVTIRIIVVLEISIGVGEGRFIVSQVDRER